MDNRGEKDKHEKERPPKHLSHETGVSKIPKKKIDPKFERVSELSQSKKPAETNRYNQSWKAQTNNKAPRRFENVFEQRMWEEQNMGAKQKGKQGKSFNVTDVMGSMNKNNKKNSYEDRRAKELEEKMKRDKMMKDKLDRQV